MIAAVIVEVATKRPPGAHAASIFVVEAHTETEAKLIAAQWAGSKPNSVMAISTQIVELFEL